MNEYVWISNYVWMGMLYRIINVCWMGMLYIISNNVWWMSMLYIIIMYDEWVCYI